MLVANRKKFSLALAEDEQAGVNLFQAMWGKQFFGPPLNHARAIRLLLRWAIENQDIIPACHLEEREWLHLANEDGRPTCGAKSKKTVPLESEAELSCPDCLLRARHHESKTQASGEQPSEP